MDIYEPSTFPGACTRANRYSRTRMDQTVFPQGDICTVEEAGLGIYKINSFASMPPQLRQPETFLDVLMEQSCTWMWGYLRLTGDDGWVAKAINEDSLVAVTDGSYM